MKTREKNGKNILLLGIQLLSAISFAAFVYMQMCLINGLQEQQLQPYIMLGTAGLLILAIGSEVLEVYLRGRKYADCCVELKHRSVKAFFAQALREHGRKSEEEQLSFFANDVDTVLNEYVYMELYGKKLLFQFVFTFAALLIVSFYCGMAVTIAMAGFSIAIHIRRDRLTKKQQRVQEQKAVFTETLTQLHEGFEEIHLNQMEAAAEEEFKRENNSLEEAVYAYRQEQLVLETLGVGQNMLIYMLVLVVGAALAYDGMAGVGVFLSAAELSVQALNEWSLLSRVIVKLKGTGSLKKEIEAYLQKAEFPEKGTEQVLEKETKQTSEEDILLEVKNLAFAYEQGELLWENVNLKIYRGKKYLISGPSGSGKTTFLELLMGHRIAQTGQVDRFTDKIAYVSQEPFLFHGTLRENIVFEGGVQERQLCEVLQKLELDLEPDHIIEEHGENLSGGQKTRVALARALMMQPKLLVVDELTANMDSGLGSRLEEMLLTQYPQMALCAVAHKTYCAENYDLQIEIDPVAGLVQRRAERCV